MKQVDSDEIESRNTEYIDDEWLLEIMIGKPWGNPEENARNQYTRAYLHDECEFQEIFCFPVFFFDDVFWQEIVQALSTAKVVECSEQAHKANHPIDHTDTTDREIVWDNDFDHIAEWPDQ